MCLVSTYLDMEDHIIQPLNHWHYRCNTVFLVFLYFDVLRYFPLWSSESKLCLFSSSGFLAGHDGGDVPRHGPFHCGWRGFSAGEVAELGVMKVEISVAGWASRGGEPVFGKGTESICHGLRAVNRNGPILTHFVSWTFARWNVNGWIRFTTWIPRAFERRGSASGLQTRWWRLGLKHITGFEQQQTMFFFVFETWGDPGPSNRLGWCSTQVVGWLVGWLVGCIVCLVGCMVCLFGWLVGLFVCLFV